MIGENDVTAGDAHAGDEGIVPVDGEWEREGERVGLVPGDNEDMLLSPCAARQRTDANGMAQGGINTHRGAGDAILDCFKDQHITNAQP